MTRIGTPLSPTATLMELESEGYTVIPTARGATIDEALEKAERGSAAVTIDL